MPEQLKPHQKAAILKAHEREGKVGLWIGLGGGKTRVCLGVAKLRGYRRVLVVLPRYVAPVWTLEAQKVNYHLDVHDLVSKPGVKARSEALKTTSDGLATINYESYWREPLRSQILKWQPEAVIFDESHHIRHRGSRQSRFAHTLAAKPFIDARICQSGTPVTNGLEDAWSQFRFVDPKLFGNWRDFSAMYLLPGWFPNQIAGYRNEKQAEALIASASYQWEDARPAAPDILMPVTLSPKTRALYEDLRKRAIAEITDARGQPHTVIARIILTLLIRLQQIASGFAVGLGEELVDISTEKVDATIGLIEDATAEHKPVIVFCRFTHDLELLEQHMPAHIRHARIDGSKSNEERALIQETFEADGYDVLLCQVKAASEGIDLSKAQVAIFHSVGFSLSELLQAKGRLTGALRQRHEVVFFHMVASRTVDEHIYRSLLSKTDLARRVTDLSYALNLLQSSV